MGFTTGFLGGLTLTTSLVYLSLAAHKSNRINQALLLRQQTLALHHIVDPDPPAPPPTYREVRVGILETAKDRWNSELERLVKRAYNTDWGVVGESLENGVGAIWRLGQRVGNEVEKRT